MSYTLVQPPFSLRFSEMSKDELAEYFAWFTHVIPSRIAEVTRYVNATPGYHDWQSDFSSASLGTLGEWLEGHIEMRHRTGDELASIGEGFKYPVEVPNVDLTNESYSLAVDSGMYLAEVLLKNYPALRWTQPMKSKRFADYGQPVITGFGPVDLNPVRIAVVLAFGLASKKLTGHRLREIYDYWSSRVQS